jgi:hypothetical protein
MALTGVKRIEELAALSEDGEYFDIYVFASLVQEEEREACARVCEAREEQWRKAGFFKDVHEFREMAFAIRARGKSDKQD